MSAESWERRVHADLDLSVPEGDPRREAARRLKALTPPRDAPEPGPSGIDWASDPGAAGAELRRLREASAPLVTRLPPEAPPEPEPRVLGYVAVARPQGPLVVTVGPVQALEAAAWRDAGWWAANDLPGAFVCELREVPR